MIYPEDFVKRVKKAYPNWERLHKALDSGDEIVGRYLFDNSDSIISLETILESDNLEELKKEAAVKLEKNSLYDEWGKLYDAQMPQKIG